MTNKEALQKINKVGEDFGWLMGKVGSNYENGYMKAIRDCKAVFQKDDHIVEANKMIVSADKKKMKMVKKCIYEKCFLGECDGCIFFDEWDETDGEYFCAIRDNNGNIPYHTKWDIESALKEKVE
jgi:hypothetical protein